MSPEQVKGCSVWELSEAIDGWIDAHVPDEKGQMTAAEQDDLWDAVQEKMGRV